LEKNDQGKQTLFLPEDLHLWEMMDIIKIVNRDTLARKPEWRDQRADQIKELGLVFEKAGLYLQEYLSELESGREIAQEIASQFYKYGRSLQTGKQNNDDLSHDESKLSPKEKQKLDQWFLGKDAYQKRIAKLGVNTTEEQEEKSRKKLITAYFKALARKTHYEEREEQPWIRGKGFGYELQDATRKQIIKAIEIPEIELRTAFFRRGVEHLVTEMREAGWRKSVNSFLKKIGCDPLLVQRRLYHTLQIDKLKEELGALRKTGDITAISEKELEIAKKIQKAIYSFSYTENESSPSKILETQFMNCVGGSMLGGAFLDELGIKYLHSFVPGEYIGHSTTVLITSDGKVYWQDFTPKIPKEEFNENYKEITGNMLEEGDISTLKNLPDSIDHTLVFTKWKPYKHLAAGQKMKVHLLNPEIALQYSILLNIGNFIGNEDYDKKIEVYRQAGRLAPGYTIGLWEELGIACYENGKYDQAIEAYSEAIQLNPKPVFLFHIGRAYTRKGEKNKAIKAYNEFLKLSHDERLKSEVKKRIEKISE